MALKNNTWKLNQWYDQNVAGNATYSSTLNNLYAWGANTFGELYPAGITGGEPARRSSPVQIPGTTWKDFANISGKAPFNSIASKTDGTMWVWGRNQQGALGQNNTTYYSSPVQIPGTNWTGTYDTMSGAYFTSFAIKTDGTLWSWGYNGNGALGQNDRTTRSSPVQVPGTTWAVTASTIGATYAIKTDGTLWVWGYNATGALGLNQPANTRYSSPTQIPGTTWSKIATGERNAFALKTDGTMWSWGRNESGWLGLNEGANPGPHKSSPCQIGSDTSWTSNYAVSYQGALAIKTDGTLWSWGKNNNGHLGQNSQANYSSPVQVGSESTWSSVNISGEFKVRAIKTDGTLWSWGYNHKGQLGLNDTTQRSSPTQVGSDNDWTKIGGTGGRVSYAMRGL